jgi:hypothetical protein
MPETKKDPYIIDPTEYPLLGSRPLSKLPNIGQTSEIVEAESAKLSERVGGGIHVGIHSRSDRIEV